MFRTSPIAAIVVAFALSSCGDTTGEQALIGGGVGAGAAAVFSANPIIGAAVGAGSNILYCRQNPVSC